MKNEDWTKGPWEVHLLKTGVAVYPSNRPKWRAKVTTVPVWEGTPGRFEAEANARLIAAAPDLAEAAQPFADLASEGSEDFPDETPVTVRFGRTTDYSLTLGDIRRAVTALQKARGQ
jgi:hypothetical protein